jgi:hypothetical protein
MAYSKRRPEQDAHSAIKTSHDGLVAQYRAMANDSEREREAEGWTEELISDSSAQCKSCSKQRLRIKIGSLSRTDMAAGRRRGTVADRDATTRLTFNSE